MANLVSADDRETLEEKATDEDTTWEDEVNMGVFYTDAVEYWKVCAPLFVHARRSRTRHSCPICLLF